jgi:hypothetical protein
MKRALFLSTLVLALLAAAALLLAACGGGSDDAPAGADVPTPKVDCKARPEQCV